MAFVRNDGVKGESSLILADPSGAHETHLATRRIGNDIGPFDLPSWAPDGRTITVSVADPASDGLYIHLLNVSVRDGSATSFSPVHWRSLNDTRWLPDGSGMLIAAQERSGAPQQIYWNAEGSGEVRKITGDVNSYLSLSVGSDSRSFLAVQSDINVNVWVGPGNDPDAAVQVTSGRMDGIGGLAWTTDGRIVYQGNVGDSYQIWMVNADGSAAHPALQDGAGRSFAGRAFRSVACQQAGLFSRRNLHFGRPYGSEDRDRQRLACSRFGRRPALFPRYSIHSGSHGSRRLDGRRRELCRAR